MWAQYDFQVCVCNSNIGTYFFNDKTGLLVILVECIVLQAPFLDITRMSMSTVSLLAYLGSGITCLLNAFFLTYDLNSFTFDLKTFLL